MVILKPNKEAMGWTMSDEKRTPDTLCTHSIHIDPDPKPIRQPQRRLNPPVMEIFKTEVIKPLHDRVIYSIPDGPWISLVQAVPKKTGVTMAEEDHNGIQVSTGIRNGWKLCINYRHLNLAQRKYHFPPPFTDQKIERFNGKPQCGFLDVCPEFHKIPPNLEDQKETALTRPFGSIGKTLNQTLAEDPPGIGE